MDETSYELLQRCVSAAATSDFPTIWQTILRSHRLVVGPPLQVMDGDESQLRISLITGQNLIFRSASKTFSIL